MPFDLYLGATLLEDCRSERSIHRFYLSRRVPFRECRCDDRSGARAGDVVESVRQPIVRITTAEDYDLVAEPIEITGEVVRRDDLHYLMADPSTYRRLEGGE